MKEINQSDSVELETSQYTYCTTVLDKHYLINFLYNTIDLLSPKLYKQVMQKEFHEIDPEDLLYLYARRYIRDKHINEDACFAVNPKSENLVYLVFSYACNLKCTYCFESDKNRIYQMDESTFDKTMDYIERLSGISKTILTFYGGEPLLEMNSSRIKKVIERFIDNKNIRFRFITNGINAHKFLDMFSLIKDRIDKFVITIDGPKEDHDKRRVFGNLQGTFELIMSNISMLLSHGYPVSIRLNVDYSNYQAQEELLHFLNSSFKNNDNIQIEYHRIEDKNNPHFIPVTYLDCYKLYQKAKRISNFMVKFSVPLLVALENMKEQKEGFADLCNSCCSMNRNHVIDLDGVVYSCNEAMGIEDFRFANVRDELSVTPKTIKKDYCSCPFFFACYCNCTLKKYYTSLENENMKCEYLQMEELVHCFLESI